MHQAHRLRANSLLYFFLSIVFRFSYVAIFFLVRGLSGTQHVILHLLLAVASLVMGWLALRLFWKGEPGGSSAGCLYLILLLLNLVGGIGAMFFAMVHMFHQQGSGDLTLWIF